jgi:Zn-dependent protease
MLFQRFGHAIIHSQNSQMILFYILILFMSVVIHEVAHGYAARMLGDRTAEYEGRLTLNPLVHIDPIGSVIVPIITSLAGFPFGWAKPVPFNPYNLRSQRWGELIVAAAGPLSNIAIAVVFGLIIRFGAGELSASFLAPAFQVVLINLSLAIFNLIPIPPLDGSKILFGILPFRFNRIRWQLERYSMILVFAIILIPSFTIILTKAVYFSTKILTGLAF